MYSPWVAVSWAINLRCRVCVTWRLHICDMTRLSCNMYSLWVAVSWAINLRCRMCVTWRLHICDMTCSHMWRDSFIYVTCWCCWGSLTHNIILSDTLQISASRDRHVLRCVALCCGVLQHVTLCCSVVQCVAACCATVNCSVSLSVWGATLTQWHTWRDSLTHVHWRIYVWHDVFTYVTWCIDTCAVTRISHMWHDSFAHVTWLIHTHDVMHSHVGAAEGVCASLCFEPSI